MYVTVPVAAFCWLFVATAVVLRDRYGLWRRRAVGLTLTAAGVPLGALSGLVAAVGLERALTVWNDQMALLPWGLSRILGITVHLGIPADLPMYAAVAGAALTAVGLLLSIGRRRQTATHRPPSGLDAQPHQRCAFTPARSRHLLRRTRSRSAVRPAVRRP